MNQSVYAHLTRQAAIFIQLGPQPSFFLHNSIIHISYPLLFHFSFSRSRFSNGAAVPQQSFQETQVFHFLSHFYFYILLLTSLYSLLLLISFFVSSYFSSLNHPIVVFFSLCHQESRTIIWFRSWVCETPPPDDQTLFQNAKKQRGITIILVSISLFVYVIVLFLNTFRLIDVYGLIIECDVPHFCITFLG